jgi:hypothetical protein
MGKNLDEVAVLHRWIIEGATASFQIIEPEIEDQLLGVWLDALDLNTSQIARGGHAASPS